MGNHNPEDFVRIDYDGDPERCQFITPHKGQCNLKATEGTQYCRSHGGVKSNTQIQQGNYRTRWRAMIQQKIVEQEDIYDLTEEIGILRLTLEAFLNRCTEDLDLVMAAGPMADLIMKIERTVSSLHKLRQANGDLLDKTAVLRFVSKVVGILTAHYGDDPEKLDLVAKEIIGAVDDKELHNSGSNDSNIVGHFG